MGKNALYTLLIQDATGLYTYQHTHITNTYKITIYEIKLFIAGYK